ncbi:hypothetical protein [[Eubacterium] cellulosolvens]
MAKPRIVPKSEKKGKPKIIVDDEEWDIEKAGEDLKVNTAFSPRKKGPGDLIQADDWNNIQFEIKDDLTNIVTAVNNLASKSQFLIASGVSSHDMFVELNWGIKPHVILSYSGPMNGSIDTKRRIRCYPCEISEKGFRVFAQSDDGEEKGVVNWIAIGVVQ